MDIPPPRPKFVTILTNRVAPISWNHLLPKRFTTFQPNSQSRSGRIVVHILAEHDITLRPNSHSLLRRFCFQFCAKSLCDLQGQLGAQPRPMRWPEMARPHGISCTAQSEDPEERKLGNEPMPTSGIDICAARLAKNTNCRRNNTRQGARHSDDALWKRVMSTAPAN